MLGAALLFCPPALADGSFQSSDALLNSVWQASVKTANDMVIPGPLSTDAEGRACVVSLPAVISDGYARDRCPYTGDIAVTGATMLVSTPSDFPTLRSMIGWFANQQEGDGEIPGTPDSGGEDIFDYNGYWVEELYDYTLFTGDLRFAQSVFGNLQRLLNVWYPSVTGSDGLLADNGQGTYSYLLARPAENSYLNAQYGLTLEDAAKLAGWLGDSADDQSWTNREQSLAKACNATFWDPDTDAYADATSDNVHAEDGNSFAILAGIASPLQAASALNYLAAKVWLPYGNALSDIAMDGSRADGSRTNETAFPFITYREVLARFQAGLDDSALDLIRREWGYMEKNGPGTMWEWIAQFGGPPNVAWPSFDHGWSSGAAPALTEDVLGVVPTSPGFKTFTVVPHSGDLAWAKGSVPTPNGNISVSWSWQDSCATKTLKKGRKLVSVKQCGKKLSLSVQAPAGDTWTK